MSICYILVFFVSGCASLAVVDDEKDEFHPKTHLLAGDPNKHKSIFVFLDGTANDQNSGTNVSRLYETILENNDPQMMAMYIEGVGSVEKRLSGLTLGRGMEERILRGYVFISQHYNPGDDVYIFGFSRGAHQARSLAGLLSYAGVPIQSSWDQEDLMDLSNTIIELVKKKSDEDYLDQWASWSPDQAPLLAREMKEKLKLEMRKVEISFLGVWDTVPGSSLKNYEDCKEKKGFVKNNLSSLIPGVDKGERYKSDSYPPIRHIAHAVSLDEKRSKFRPLLLCPVINSRYTKINEVWFPGAHSDVGGGYQDSDELPTISLAWMIGLLEESYTFNTRLQFQGNAKGLAHWSFGDSPGNIGSDCIDRPEPAQNKIHKSVNERKKSSPVPIRWKGTIKSLNYPIDCPNM